MRRLLFWSAVILFLRASVGFAQQSGQSTQQNFLQVARQLREEGLRHGQAFALLRELTALGPRVAGSPQAAAAVEWMRQKMVDLGLENVHLEPVTVQRWQRGDVEEARAFSPKTGGGITLRVCALGGSVATPPDGLAAPVIEVRSFDELHRLGDRVRGKIVFLNHPMNPVYLNTFRAYGEAARYRTQGAVEAAKMGAVAVVVRSLTLHQDDVPHTGVMFYSPNVPKIPAAALGILSAERLSRMIRLNPDTRLFLRLNCRTLSPVPSANVVGDLRGTGKPQEIVLLGGHLDSWDLGVGAHDDGAGCIHALEAVRLLKALHLRPRRTIRVTLFMNEEFGRSGGRDYAVSPLRNGEKHIAAIESDRGGFLPLGFGISADSLQFARYQRWLPVLREAAGILWLRRGGGGSDVAPLRSTGTVLIGLVPDSQRYFDVHHSANDVLAAVHPRELELGAIAMSMLAYLLAEDSGAP